MILDAEEKLKNYSTQQVKEYTYMSRALSGFVEKFDIKLNVPIPIS